MTDSLKYANFDISDLSLVRITFTGNKPTDESFNAYLDELESLYNQRKPLGIIFDATKAVAPKLSYQKLQAQWLNEHWLLIKNYCKGTAYVIPSAPIRLVLKMIFSFQNQPVPYKIFSKMEEAVEWLNSLEDKTLPV
jgi:hypothetical protein